MASRLGRAARAGRIVKGPSPTPGGAATQHRATEPRYLPRGGRAEGEERSSGRPGGCAPRGTARAVASDSECAGQARPRAKGLNYQELDLSWRRGRF